MKADLSRITFRPEKGYTRVIAQQGRVDLDADRNEAQDIRLAHTRTAIRDLFGPFGGPANLFDVQGDWGRPNEAFLIQAEGSGNSIKDLVYGKGRYYVDGWLCDSHGGNYNDQANLPWDEDNAAHEDFKLPANVPFLVYLDVWERLVTMVEDESIREVALAGPDTAARAQLICQVRTKSDEGVPSGINALADFTLDDFITWWSPILKEIKDPNRGRLNVVARRPDNAGENPCLAEEAAQYIGPENYFYRVEIHTPGAIGDATFKYSRNGGSIVAALKEIDGKFLTIDGIYDPGRGFSAGQWVEILDDERVYLGQPGTLVQVSKVEGDELTINTATANGTLDPDDFKTNPKVRRWDQTGKGPLTLEGGAIKVKEGEPIDLEYGISVEFKDGGGSPVKYRSGDYWVFPARYLSGDVEWPEGQFLPPFGVRHYYAPLAVVRSATDVVDLRKLKETWTPA